MMRYVDETRSEDLRNHNWSNTIVFRGYASQDAIICLHKSAAVTVLVNYDLSTEPIAFLRVYHFLNSDLYRNIHWVDSLGRGELVHSAIDVQIGFFIIILALRRRNHILCSFRNQWRRFKQFYLIFDCIVLPGLRRTSGKRFRDLIDQARPVCYRIIKFDRVKRKQTSRLYGSERFSIQRRAS